MFTNNIWSFLLCPPAIIVGCFPAPVLWYALAQSTERFVSAPGLLGLALVHVVVAGAHVPGGPRALDIGRAPPELLVSIVRKDSSNTLLHYCCGTYMPSPPIDSCIRLDFDGLNFAMQWQARTYLADSDP